MWVYLLLMQVIEKPEPALIQAVRANDVARCVEMVNEGVDLGVQGRIGTTALIEAVRNKNPTLVALLVSSKAELDQSDTFGWTPLMMAASEGSTDLVRYLVDAGADVNAADKEGITVLMWASTNLQHKSVQMLLTTAVDRHAQDKRGRTAMDFVAHSDDEEMVSLLASAGIQAKTMKKRVVMLAPPSSDRKDTMRVALSSDADIEKSLDGQRFEIRQLNGDLLDLERYRGKVVLIDFWATWCKPCLMSVPTLKYLKDKMDSDHFVLIGISADKDVEVLREFLERNDLPWLHHIDPYGLSSRKDFKVKSYPTYALLDTEGELIFATEGWSRETESMLRSNVSSAVRKARKASRKRDQ